MEAVAAARGQRAAWQRMRRRGTVMAAAAAACAAVLQAATPSGLLAATGAPPAAPLMDSVPKEARIFRKIETPVPDARLQKKLDRKKMPDWYGGHPCPEKEESVDRSIPGGVQNTTTREKELRALLRDGIVEKDKFEKTIQVFAQRARQEIRWLTVQRREFIRRAKRWANEMIIQGMQPSSLSVRLILLGCSSVGDVDGAEYWFRHLERFYGPVGRLDYNAVMGAFARDGMPHEVTEMMKRMREAGLKPDASSYASLVDAWEVTGNRQQMLQAMVAFQEAEAAGELGQPLDPRDEGLPYYAMARTYVKAADAPRAISVLKMLQKKNIKLTREAHRLRLEVHLSTPTQRRSIPQIESALRDLVAARPKSGPLYQSRLADRSRRVLGDQRYEQIIGEFGVTDEDLVPALPSSDEKRAWRRANIKAALKRYVPGMGVLQRNREDENFMKRNRFQRASVNMGEVKNGYRIPGEEGLPEWMTIKKPEKYG